VQQNGAKKWFIKRDGDYLPCPEAKCVLPAGASQHQHYCTSGCPFFTLEQGKGHQMHQRVKDPLTESEWYRVTLLCRPTVRIFKFMEYETVRV